MRKQIHILNGDALKNRFPKEILGEVIVCREALVDGNVSGHNLESFFENRARFLSENYGGTIADYHEKVVPEFRKMQELDNEAEVNLWFEDDLFCQVNFWFCVHVLSGRSEELDIHLVRPDLHSQYGFGGLNNETLIKTYHRRSKLTDVNGIAALWSAYQEGDLETLLDLAKALQTNYPFIADAVQAHIDRIPKEGNPGRPKQTLVEIMDDLNTQEFGPVFREFCERESIYGFGDLQVKRMFDELISENGT